MGLVGQTTMGRARYWFIKAHSFYMSWSGGYPVTLTFASPVGNSESEADKTPRRQLVGAQLKREARI